MKKCHENGRSMVEMIGVIAIIGVISAGGLMGYSKAMYKFQMSKTVSMITQSLQDYAIFLKGDIETYPNITAPDQVKQYKLMTLCEKDQNDSAACQMPLGKIYPNFSITDSTNAEADIWIYEYNMTISFEKSQKNACIDFLVHDWNHMVPDRWWRYGNIKVSSNQNTTGQIVYSSSVNKLNPAGATEVCNSMCGTNISKCNIVFYFKGEKY